MSIQIKLHVEDMVINVLDYYHSITQNTDHTGRPSAKPVVLPIKFTYETRKDDPFLDKLINGTMSDRLTFKFSPVSMNGSSSTVEVLDFYIKKHQENFDGVNNQPMITYIEVTFATLIVNGVVMDSKYWKKTDPYPKTPTTTLNYNEEKEEDEKIIKQYITDRNDIELNEYKMGDKIFYVVESQNMEGKTIDIKLNDKKVDFLYQDKRLKEDTISNFTISSEIEKIPLQVIYEAYNKLD